MKLISISLTLILGITLNPSIAYSQEQEGCFMLDANGQRVDLGNLCPDSGASQSGVFQVPIKRREGGIPVIDVKFNGNYTFEMLLDTGASHTVLTPQMAAKLGIEPQETVILETAGGIIPAPTGQVASIETGGVRATNVRVLITPALSLGLLGQNFFGEYDLMVKENTIEFHRRN